jgi:transposase
MKWIRQIRGSRQEVIDPSQLQFFSLEELQEFATELEQRNAGQDAAADDQVAITPDSQSPQRNPAGRRPLPAHLPREVKRYELNEADRRYLCCGEVRQEFAVEPSEQLEYVPGYFKVIRYERVKYACKGCQEQVIVAPRDPQPIEKGLPASALPPTRRYRNSAITCRCVARKISTAASAGRSAAAPFAVACWVHTRRYWWNAQDLDQDRVNVALRYITQLFQIEDQLRQAYPAKNLQGERDFAAVAEARQQRSSPILDRFKTWLDDEQGSNRIPPKSPVRTAFTYTLSQWEALRRYTEQGIFVDGQQHLRAAVQDSGDRQEALSICEQRTGLVREQCCTIR